VLSTNVILVTYCGDERKLPNKSPSNQGDESLMPLYKDNLKTIHVTSIKMNSIMEGQKKDKSLFQMFPQTLKLPAIKKRKERDMV
jgi:hypothetical protein